MGCGKYSASAIADVTHLALYKVPEIRYVHTYIYVPRYKVRIYIYIIYVCTSLKSAVF
jgi:hypothetical protein